MANQPRSVLFACTLNRVRSPMAEALARRFYGDALKVDSCGCGVAEESDPFAAEVLAEIGADSGARGPKTFAAVEGRRFDLIVALTPEARAKAETLVGTISKAMEYWPTEDPTLTLGSRDQRLEAYRMVRDGLRRRLIARFGPPST